MSEVIYRTQYQARAKTRWLNIDHSQYLAGPEEARLHLQQIRNNFPTTTKLRAVKITIETLTTINGTGM